MKTRIVTAVLGLLMLSMTAMACGTIAGGAIELAAALPLEQEPAMGLKKAR